MKFSLNLKILIILMISLIDKLFNGRLRKHLMLPYVTLITGDRGSGKSTLFALIAQECNKQGLKVFSQYPYKDCFIIPMEKKIINGIERYDVSKKWLYETDFTDSVILLDEVKTIWNARAYSKWSMEDEEFFNFIRKYNTRVFMATQAYDGVDLNVRRASDECLYLSKGHFGFTHIEASTTTIAKVADKNTEVLGRMFKQGMRKVVWDVCEVPTGHFLFYRKPYYKDFITEFTYQKKSTPKLENWNSRGLLT